ncbi:MAG: hypothetical protein ACRDGF_02580, partial [Chloroflexota bacterium]
RTDGRPDGRSVVGDASSELGNLAADFNFDAPPRPPLIESLEPAPSPEPAQRSVPLRGIAPPAQELRPALAPGAPEPAPAAALVRPKAATAPTQPGIHADIAPSTSSTT